MSTPILLSGEATLAASSTAIVDAAAVSSPFREPVIIDEIGWTMFASAASGNERWDFGGLVRTKLRMGRIAITSTRDGGGFVPIWNLSPALQDIFLVEALRDATYTDLVQWISHFRWKLPKPLIVPSGQTLISEFYRGADGFSSSVTVSVGYSGRYCPPGFKVPHQIDVPFASVFEPPGAATSSVAQSMELDLVNPFNVPLQVQRFIGRIQYTDSLSSQAEALSSTAPVLTIKDSWGNNVVRDFSPFATVFDSLRRAWTFQKILNPKERYLISLRDMSSAVNFPMISIIGSRKEEI